MPLSRSGEWLYEWTGTAQPLLSCTVLIRTVPVGPIHIKTLLILDILTLPWLRYPSTRSVIMLPSLLPHVGSLIKCPM